MRPEELEKLIGGYATGTLTAQERARLFEAALTDQALFNELADEQSLKELLDNPHARRRLLAALRAQSSRPSLLSRLRGWLLPPAVRAVAGGLAVAVLAVTTVTRLLDIAPPPAEVTEESRRAKSVDKLTAGKKEAAPKKPTRQAPAAAPEKALRETDTKHDEEAGRQAPAAPPQTEMKASELPSAAPETKTEPAAKAEEPASLPQDLLARSDVARSVQPGTRALFYDVSTQRLGLRYGIVPSKEGPALVVEVNQRGYLYAIARDTKGAATLVYPAFLINPQTALAEPGLRYFIPPTGALSGSRLTLVLSRTPLKDPTGVAAAKLSEKKDALLRQETPEPPLEGVGGPTVYAVESAPVPASSLLVEIVVPAR
jgi:hypothetical protein